MTDLPSAYQDRRIALATMHRKEQAIAPTFKHLLGATVVAATDIDTDQLGTFSGEVSRRGTMREVAIAKARLGMQATGLSLGLASEGSFGPHPQIPFMPGAIEVMTFVDDERGMVIHESRVVDETNFAHVLVTPGDSLEQFLNRLQFPSHAVIVRPNAGDIYRNVGKGIQSRELLSAAIADAARVSTDGKAHIETDMRAHMNPTRMRSLAELAGQLAERLASVCPACASPGWGRVDVVSGLPCDACGTPTEMVAAEVFGCPACSHKEQRPRRDGLTHAKPGNCPYCNP